MRKLLLSAVLVSGLTLSGVGAYALEDQPQEPQSQQQVDQGTQEQTQDTGTMEQQNKADEGAIKTDEQNQASGEEYVVQQGDTLAKIAQEKLGSADKWKDIAEANNIDNPNALQVGQRLTIPSSDQMNSTQENGSEKGTSEDQGNSTEEGGSQSAPQHESSHQQEGGSQGY